MQSNNKGLSPLTEQEVEKIRLLLSVYQDGSGMLALDNGLSIPGWRDFERAVAAALGGKPPKGEGQEGKNVFDVSIPIYLPDPHELLWDFPNVVKRKGGEEKVGRRIRGRDSSGTIFEWYGESGGQLKYYPLAEMATWSSDIFRLESLPLLASEYGLFAKVKQYFPRTMEDSRKISYIIL